MTDRRLSPGVFVREVPQPGPPPITPVETSVTGFVGGATRGPRDSPVPIRSWGEFERAFGPLTSRSHLGYSVRDFFRNGGRRAIVVRVGDDDGSVADDDLLGATDATGIRALAVSEHVGLVVVPPNGSPGVARRGDPLAALELSAPVVAAVVDFASRRRAMAVLDAPAGLDPRSVGAADLAHLPDSPDAAVYAPRVTGADPLRAADTLRAPSGAIAGLFARTDATHGVWKAPAGTDATLAGIGGLATSMRDDDIGRLTDLRVNALRQATDGSVLVWGARTHSSDREWRYVPVRRTVNFLEESIERGLAWTVFEQNDANLQARVRAMVADFLDGLFRAGAFRGTAPDDACFVRADSTTTTPADVAAGRLHVVIGVALVAPAEFTVITVTARTAVAP
ncbi:phage tail sheath family protein [Agromyces sp. SYSU T00194]|uniref:phage tail sheath family protein n=1 Tax=Agromyces chitinivorans TaxID=3158560 RepID=UPI003393BC0C